MDSNVKLAASVLVVGLVVGAGATAALANGLGGPAAPSDGPEDPTVEDGVTTFGSASEYTEYMQSSGGAYAGMGAAGGADVAMDAGGDGAAMDTTAEASAVSAEAGSASSDSQRIGGTNVQEQGIDEPDLVATVGQHFVYAPRGRMHYAVQRDVATSEAPTRQGRSANVVDASEAANPALVAEINATGKLLRSGDSLVAMGDGRLVGYDVSDPENPTRTWTKSLNSSIRTARMNDGQLYLVTRTSAERACPIRPMEDSTVDCTTVYHPRVQVDADATYTAYSIDPAAGDVADSTSFVGTRGSTVVYMSDDSLYVTYTKETSQTELATDYLLEEAEAVPSDVKDRIREIQSYDLSAQAERIEIQRTIRGWIESLPADEREGIRETLSADIREYATEHRRDATETGIVRIGVGGGSLSVDATGTVPGRPLDQFSMDEREGTLRIATTIPELHGAPSVNDLYTLDTTSLDRMGAEQGMGEDERIYSVRYVDDTAYMVTFRQIDPFHVVDLSNPSEPEELGNVELPGFSNYLHPVGEDTIMGIGEEDGEVKAVLFDVSDPANPTVADSKILDARWSAVSQTHHAFMQDPRHGVAFIPAGEQGIVLDYADQSLSVEKRIDTSAPPERARYVGDHLYVFTPGEIAVYDETDWTEAANLSLSD